MNPWPVRGQPCGPRAAEPQRPLGDQRGEHGSGKGAPRMAALGTLRSIPDAPVQAQREGHEG